MKRIKYSLRFLRNFRKRISHNEQLVEAYKESVDTFLSDRASTGDHTLEGKMRMLSAFDITDDYRILYCEFREYFLFEDIGTHEQVYRR